ncbi:hypothetical protein [Nitrosopumilus ureiphilus]|nr:hypothetical protein [Nitrosopumilus ureiphilus]
MNTKQVQRNEIVIHDFTKKVTRNFLAKLFDERFQAKKSTKYECGR